MPISIIDNISDYRVTYNLDKSYQDTMDSIDLLFEKGMLKTTKNNDCKFLYPIFKPYSILVRIVIYSLMDYRELVGETEFKAYEYIDWLSAGKMYRNYLILIWITKKLKEYEKDNWFFRQTCKVPIESNPQIKQSNLQSFNCFDVLNIEEYKRSTLKDYTMNKHKLKNAIYLLSNSVFIDVFDKQSISDVSIIKVDDINDKTKVCEYIKLNKAFFRIERRFKYDNWLF